AHSILTDVRSNVMARHRDHAGKLAMVLHAHDWVWREHDFVQCIVLLVDDPVRVLARGVGLEEGSGHSPGWAKGSGPGWEPLNLKDRVITDRRWMQAPPRGKNSSRRASMEE